MSNNNKIILLFCIQITTNNDKDPRDSDPDYFTSGFSGQIRTRSLSQVVIGDDASSTLSFRASDPAPL